MSDIEELKAELAEVLDMSDSEVCECYNVDEKSEAIEDLQREIRSLEKEEFYTTEEELERERTFLCLSQGISRY